MKCKSSFFLFCFVFFLTVKPQKGLILYSFLLISVSLFLKSFWYKNGAEFLSKYSVDATAYSFKKLSHCYLKNCIIRTDYRFKKTYLKYTVHICQNHFEGRSSKNFAMFTGKHLCWSLFRNKVTGQTLLKRDPNTVVFLWMLQNF